MWGINNECNSPICWVPNADHGVQTARGNLLTIEGYGIDLTEVTLKSSKALALGYAPYLGGRVVAAAHDQISVYLQASNTGTVADKNMLADAFLHIPNAQRGIA